MIECSFSRHCGACNNDHSGQEKKMHPISDKRYTITKEFTGKAEPQWVARFCDEWIGSSPTHTGALMKVCSHKALRDKKLDDAMDEAAALLKKVRESNLEKSNG